MIRPFTIVALLLCACLPAVADAQMVQRPQRPFRGLFGGGPPPDPARTRQELTLMASFLGGYSDWISPLGSDAILSGQQQGGRSGLVEGTMRYWRGRAVRFISVEGRGAAMAQGGFSSAASAEGSARLRAATSLGFLDRVEFSQEVSYEPTLSLEGVTPSLGDAQSAPLPDSGSPSGLQEQRSWFVNSTVTSSQNWTARQFTVSSYTYSQRTYLDEFGFDTRSHLATVEHNWNVRRSVGLTGTYRYSGVRMTDPEGRATPVNDHGLQFGATLTRRLSPSRQFRLSASAGTTHVSTLSAVERLPLDYWTPVAEASSTLDVGRSWAVTANYNHGVNVLPGATQQSFATDSALVRADGTIGSRLEAAFSGAFANGRSGGGDSLARYETYTGIAQLRFALVRWASATVSYDYYYYRLRDVPDVPTGLPPQYDRNAVRVGLTLWLPLYGSYTHSETERSRRN